MKVYRIGFVLLAARDPRATEDFAQALRALGYVEGQNLVVEYRIAEGKVDRLPDLAAEPVRLPVDLILTFGTPAAKAPICVQTLRGGTWGGGRDAAKIRLHRRHSDPRELTLIAFGGSGPVHGCRLAQALGIPRVILPGAAGVTAAIGLLAAEVRFDVARSYIRRLDAVDGVAVTAMFEEMARQAVAVVRESAVTGEITMTRSVDARYLGQGYELTVPAPPGPLDAAALARIRRSFDEVYAARYGCASPSELVEVVTWNLAAVGGTPRVALAKARPQPEGLVRKGVRRAYFPETGGYADCPVYDRYNLSAGMSLTGPAIVEERESTTVLPPGPVATVDEYASLIVEVAGR